MTEIGKETNASHYLDVRDALRRAALRAVRRFWRLTSSSENIVPRHWGAPQ